MCASYSGQFDNFSACEDYQGHSYIVVTVTLLYAYRLYYFQKATRFRFLMAEEFLYHSVTL